MYDYAVQFWNKYGAAIQINAIAGSEHSANSWHYEGKRISISLAGQFPLTDIQVKGIYDFTITGNTMDVACTTPVYHCGEIEDFCRARGAIELCYPGSACGVHETWVHCAMPLD